MLHNCVLQHTHTHTHTLHSVHYSIQDINILLLLMAVDRSMCQTTSRLIILFRQATPAVIQRTDTQNNAKQRVHTTLINLQLKQLSATCFGFFKKPSSDRTHTASTTQHSTTPPQGCQHSAWHLARFTFRCVNSFL